MFRIGSIVGLAFFLLVGYLIAGWFVDGYFGGDIVPDALVRDSWGAPDSWADWRDVVIVLTAVAWLVAGLAWLAAGVAAVFVFIVLRRMLRDNVTPAVESLRGSLDNLRGTTEFAGETVASPLIRAYSVVKGVRSGLGAITDLPSFIRNRKAKGRKSKKKR